VNGNFSPTDSTIANEADKSNDHHEQAAPLAGAESFHQWAAARPVEWTVKELAKREQVRTDG
jgi:hypothetical protein